MRRRIRWLGLLCAVGIGFSVAACDEEEVPTEVEKISDQAAESTTNPVDAVLPVKTLFDVSAQVVPANNCMGDEAVGFVQGMSSPDDLNCTSNDVVIALADIDSCIGCTGGDGSPGNPWTCTEGTVLTISGSVELQSNSNSRRSDIGWWIAEDGGDAQTGTCQHFYFDTSGDPTGLDDLDDISDACGDIAAKDYFAGIPLKYPVTQFDVVCQDSDADNQLDASACTGWKIPGDDQVCPNDADGDSIPGTLNDYVKGTLPANKAKCRCDQVNFPVGIERSATVTVIKDLNPPGDPGKFDLLIKDYLGTTVKTADDVGDGGTTSHLFTWLQSEEGTNNKASVVELVGSPNPGLEYYTKSYSCTEANNGQTTQSGSGAGPVNLTLANNDAWTCTFVNDRIAVPTITVSKDATPTFTREWGWSITKQAFFGGDLTEIPTGTLLDPLMPGQTVDADYKVTVTPTPTDKDWAVSGTITVTVAGSLPPYSGTITVADTLTPGDIPAAVDCDDQTEGDQNTVDVTAAGQFTCSYSANLPDGTTRTNTAYASTTWSSGDPGSNSGTAQVAFTTPTTETDEIAYVCDDKGSSPVSTPCTDASGDYLGSADRTSQMFPYPNDVPACVPPGGSRLNTAKFTTNDTAAEDSAKHALSWECNPPPPGCTLTQGYWKTHSEFGPAPYDDAWGGVTGTGAGSCGSAGPPSINPDGDGAGTGASVAFDTFFGSAVTNICYFDVFWTPPKGGNPWYILAHQYIAAQMNKLNEADASVVQAYLDEAAALLATYEGTQKIAKKSPDGERAKELAGYLASYNEGTYPGGPPHCEDDGYPD
ncbi:MAG: hypothetical protein ACWGON_07825 [Gemmatimonadota bacterium]